ncbi:MAG: DUF2914 domain-containing protein [Endomicrobium sp.]|jgi:hypothetical protein|nr:DUF2914 domain-containing protein [Endomicrobium sp.]
MKKFSMLLSFALLCLSAGVVFAQEAPAEPASAESSLIVAESAICTGISDKQPDGAATEFSKDVPKIYYWTKITGAQNEEAVKHIWYHGDAVIGEISLNVKTPSFRTWSSKTVYPGLEGSLSVAVVDAAGNVLKKDEFTIK